MDAPPTLPIGENIRLPKVSVIVPYSAAAATLGVALRSIQCSDYPDFEVICVNDYSLDAGEDVALAFPFRHISLLRRSGAAIARNVGASAAVGDILYFSDADVEVSRETLSEAVRTLQTQSYVSACFGAYSPKPGPSNFASVYKNLVHHYTHLHSKTQAHSFWCGCGAIRASVFRDSGGFDESYEASSVEDIELGYRLTDVGRVIVLNRAMQVRHLKKYTLSSLIRSDLWNRAVPWTLLMARKNVFYADLNLNVANVSSALLLALGLPLAIAAARLYPFTSAVLAPFAVAGLYLILNHRIFRFVRREMGWGFLLKFAPMWTFTYLYSMIGFAIGVMFFLGEKIRRLIRPPRKKSI